MPSNSEGREVVLDQSRNRLMGSVCGGDCRCTRNRMGESYFPDTRSDVAVQRAAINNATVHIVVTIADCPWRQRRLGQFRYCWWRS
jgi:hypothetical protein